MDALVGLWEWNQNYGSLHLLLFPHLRTDRQGPNYGSLMPATAVGNYWLARRSWLIHFLNYKYSKLLFDVIYSLRPSILDLLDHFTQIKKSVKMILASSKKKSVKVKERELYFYWIALIIIFKPSLFYVMIIFFVPLQTFTWRTQKVTIRGKLVKLSLKIWEGRVLWDNFFLQIGQALRDERSIIQT